jgi:hypothetical protein
MACLRQTISTCLINFQLRPHLSVTLFFTKCEWEKCHAFLCCCHLPCGVFCHFASGCEGLLRSLCPRRSQSDGQQSPMAAPLPAGRSVLPAPVCTPPRFQPGKAPAGGCSARSTHAKAIAQTCLETKSHQASFKFNACHQTPIGFWHSGLDCLLHQEICVI